MLTTHLAFVGFTSFVSGEQVGISFKKECLKDNKQTTVAAAASKAPSLLQLFDGSNEEHKTEIKVCSVKLFCTVDPITTFSLNPPLVLKSVVYNYSTYRFIPASLDPDPPRFC